MPVGELKVGQLVYSWAGRDQGRPFLVWQLAGRGRVYVVDGKLRRTSKPKLKNVLHLQAVNRVATAIAARLKQGEVVTDAEVRRAIAQLLETEQA